MRFNVAQLLKEPTGATRHYELDEDITKLDPAIEPRTHLTGKVTFIHSSNGILAIAHLSTVVRLTCDRCLEPFDWPVSFELEETFHPLIDIHTGVRLPIVPGEEELAMDEHHVIDLTEVVRQGLLVALPMHPLCRSDCAGLCPQCGHNLNEGSCDCPTPPGDPRWAILKHR
jgi:uncharacterized protein